MSRTLIFAVAVCALLAGTALAQDTGGDKASLNFGKGRVHSLYHRTSHHSRGRHPLGGHLHGRR